MSVAESLGRCTSVLSAQDYATAGCDVSATVHLSKELQSQARIYTEAIHGVTTHHVGGNSYGTAADAMRTKSWWAESTTWAICRSVLAQSAAFH